MPSVSKAQQRLMGAAEHGADFPAAEKLRSSMSHDQLHDFAAGPMTGKPEHVADTPYNQDEAITSVIKKSIAKHPQRHKNLGKHIIPRKDGKPHGTLKAGKI